MTKQEGPTDSPELAAHKKRAKLTVNQWLPEWTLLMKAHNVDGVHISYAGSGDDGGIEDVSYQDSLGNPISPPFSEDLQQKFESFIYDVMNQREFFNQDAGSQGSIHWNIVADTFDHHHQVNTSSTEDTDYDDIDDLVDSVGVTAPS